MSNKRRTPPWKRKDSIPMFDVKGLQDELRMDRDKTRLEGRVKSDRSIKYEL